jgi:hypothetical protein
MEIFHEEFVAAVSDCIKESCSDGSCITAAKVAVAIGLSDTDHLLIRECHHRYLTDTVTIQMGPNGGFRLKGVEGKKKEKAVKLSGLDADFISKVQNELNEQFSSDPSLLGLSPSFVAAKLNLNPQNGARLVNEALRSGKLVGFTSRRGRGIVPGTDDVNEQPDQIG